MSAGGIGIVTGAALGRRVRDALHDLRLILQMKTKPAMPAEVSEPLVCQLMGWGWIEGHSPHDALFEEERVQIKYSKVGYVSCKRESLDDWKYLAWVHAPYRLPRLLLLIPARVLRSGAFPKDTFHILSNIEILRQAGGLRAWEFGVETVADLERQVRRPRPQRIHVGKALDQLQAELMEQRRPKTKRGERPPVLAPLAAMRGEPDVAIGRGDLSALNGRKFRATFQGRTLRAKVVNGALIVAGVNERFLSLSAAAKHFTRYAVSGNAFWRSLE